jgi:deazaflavin-dependent oxidoreductase (nitroreductase family)
MEASLARACRSSPCDAPRVSAYADANAPQRLVRRFGGSGPGSWLFARLAPRLDRTVYRLTRGRHTFASLVSGLPVVILTTTGARSGQSRSVPVVALPTDEGFALIASNWGKARQPGWYHNLRARPEGRLSVHGDSHSFRAVELEGERRERIWKQGLKVYPGWAQYERRAPKRHIAVFLLEPV